MNHKRGRPKSRRAGCLMCKSHKDQAYSQRAVNQSNTASQLRLAERSRGIEE